MGRFSRLGNALYEGRVSIDFVGRRYLWYAISGVIVLVAVLGLTVKGLNYGIEFEGGVEYRVSLPAGQVNQTEAETIRDAVAGTGLDNASAPIVTTSGTDFIRVQTEPLNNNQSTQVVKAIQDATGVSRQDVSESAIGATWGAQIASRALLGLGVFTVLVILFIWAYFREWKMSVGAMVALLHDVVITIGVYALSGFEVTPATVTGLLTILGFSLYDTVVVFDKVRENTKNLRRSRLTYREAANLAVNQTLVRSINTSIVALLPVGALLYVGVATLGSGALKDLALALFVGMAAGAYSSIFIATPLLVQLKMREKELTIAEARAKARRKKDADRYAAVPVFTEDMGVSDDPDQPARPAREPRAGDGAVAPLTGARYEKSGLGRTPPPSHGPVRPSAASKRSQPSRQSRSRRGKQ